LKTSKENVLFLFFPSYEGEGFSSSFPPPLRRRGGGLRRGRIKKGKVKTTTNNTAKLYCANIIILY